MIDDGSSPKALNDKLLFYLWSILASDFNDTVLDDKHLGCNIILFAKQVVFFICDSFHTVDEFLLCEHFQGSKIPDLFASEFQKQTNLVIVQACLFFENFSYVFK